MRLLGRAEPPVTRGRVAAALAAVLVGMVLLLPADASAAGAARGPMGSVAATARATDGLPVPTQDPSTSNQKADQILDRSEFKRAQPGYVDRALRWIAERATDVISALFTGGAGSALAWVILGGLVGVVVLVAVRVGRTVQTDPTRPGPTMQIEVRRSPIEWRREAERFEAAGEWKNALRCRYRALVADLVARKVVRDLAGHTTGEYRADVSAALPDAAAEFGGATELFERAWYGDRPTGADENAQFRELADRVVERAGT